MRQESHLFCGLRNLSWSDQNRPTADAAAVPGRFTPSPPPGERVGVRGRGPGTGLDPEDAACVGSGAILRASSAPSPRDSRREPGRDVVSLAFHGSIVAQ